MLLLLLLLLQVVHFSYDNGEYGSMATLLTSHPTLLDKFELFPLAPASVGGGGGGGMSGSGTICNAGIAGGIAWRSDAFEAPATHVMMVFGDQTVWTLHLTAGVAMAAAPTPPASAAAQGEEQRAAAASDEWVGEGPSCDLHMEVGKVGHWQLHDSRRVGPPPGPPTHWAEVSATLLRGTLDVERAAAALQQMHGEGRQLSEGGGSALRLYNYSSAPLSRGCWAGRQGIFAVVGADVSGRGEEKRHYMGLAHIDVHSGEGVLLPGGSRAEMGQGGEGRGQAADGEEEPVDPRLLAEVLTAVHEACGSRNALYRHTSECVGWVG